MSVLDWKVMPSDIAILCELAKRVLEASESPINQERIRLFYQHDTGPADRPLILSDTDGGIGMVIPGYQPKCQEPWAQQFEYNLQGVLMHHEIIQDDEPVAPWINLPWQISISDYGVQLKNTNPELEAGHLKGAYHIDKVIEDLDRDFDLLRPRTFCLDREASNAQKALLEEVFDGILGVRMRGNPWWTMGLTQNAIMLIGLEELMVYMYDQPEALHRLMAFLRDDNMALLDWMTQQNLLNLNNENDYIGSGSRGYTHTLPRQPESPISTQDLWGLIESQETVGVGPKLYEEFIYPYENSLAQRFGRVYYGCCEPVHTRWEVLKNMANLKRVSVSPWCDEDFMGEVLADNIVYSRKPNPTLISTEVFNEDLIRNDLRKTLSVTSKNNCSTELVMKDVHTLNNEPNRLTRWVKIAREVIAEYY